MSQIRVSIFSVVQLNAKTESKLNFPLVSAVLKVIKLVCATVTNVLFFDKKKNNTEDFQEHMLRGLG